MVGGSRRSRNVRARLDRARAQSQAARREGPEQEEDEDGGTCTYMCMQVLGFAVPLHCLGKRIIEVLS